MSDFGQTQETDKHAVSNGIPPPSIDLPLPESADTVTANLLLLVGQTPNPRLRFIYEHLVRHLHALIRETNLTSEEWMAAIDFLKHVGKISTSQRPEMRLLFDVFGGSALISALNNPTLKGETESSILGPFYSEDTVEVEFGESIAPEEKGEYMYVEGRVLTMSGEPIADATIDTWHSDANGLYDMEYADKTHPDCRGRVHTRKDGSFGYRAIVPPPYPVAREGPVADLFISQARHNMRPSHLHLLVEAPGYRKLVTALYPEECPYVTSDAVFGVKQSLVVKLMEINDDGEVRKRGFPKGSSFKLLKYDVILVSEEEYQRTRKQAIAGSEH